MAKTSDFIINQRISIGTANGLSLTDRQISLSLADADNAGALSAADYTKLQNLVREVDFEPTDFTLSNGQYTFTTTGTYTNSTAHVVNDSGAQVLADLVYTDTNIALTVNGTPDARFTGKLIINN